LLIGGTIGQPLEASIVPFAAHAISMGRQAAGRFMRMVQRRGLTVGAGAAVLGALLLWMAMLVARPEAVSSRQVLWFYVLLSPAAVAWCIAGLYSGSLVSAWRLEASAVGYGFRGAGALVGACAGGVVRELWPVALGVSVGEWGRVWWLRMHWTRALRAMDDGSGGRPEKGFVAAAGHQMLAQGLLSGAQFFERFLVGTVAVAAISRIEYAYRLIMVAAVLFDGGVGPWLLARWANVRVRERLRSDWTTVYQPLVFAGLLALLLSWIIAAGAPMIVGVILHHGAFTGADATIVTLVLRWYAVGFFFNMSALCVERLLLARAQNRLFAGLAAVRAGVRLGVILLSLGRLGILALPAGYIASEATYLVALLIASRVEARVLLHAVRS
jgi:peptidoglycan biosynthesis protein MviN/MurJ (putative lipid II flippase)